MLRSGTQDPDVGRHPYAEGSECFLDHFAAHPLRQISGAAREIRQIASFRNLANLRRCTEGLTPRPPTAAIREEIRHQREESDAAGAALRQRKTQTEVHR